MVDTHPMHTIRVGTLALAQAESALAAAEKKAPRDRRTVLIAAGAVAAFVFVACAAGARTARAHRAATAPATPAQTAMAVAAPQQPSDPPATLGRERESVEIAQSAPPSAHGLAESSAEVPYIEIEDAPAPAKLAPKAKKTNTPRSMWSSIKRFFSK
jgi:hypothetical protein